MKKAKDLVGKTRGGVDACPSALKTHFSNQLRSEGKGSSYPVEGPLSLSLFRRQRKEGKEGKEGRRRKKKKERRKGVGEKNY